MPRQTNRDFTALAMSQNYAAWGELPPERGTLALKALPRIEANAHRSQADHLAARRERLVERINETIRLPRMFWDHQYFRHLPGSVLETDEAVAKLRRETARELGKCRARHWSANPGKLAQLREAMVFARYFRRFGKRVWLRQAEAA